MGRRWNAVKSMFGGRSGAKALAVPDAQSVIDGMKAFDAISLIVNSTGFIPEVRFVGNTLEQVFVGSVWAYAAIAGNAGACGSLPGIVQGEGTEEGQADWIRDKNHPLTRFIKQPLPPNSGLPDWAWQQVTELACMQLDLCGNSYWRILDTTGGSVWVQPLNPQDVEPILKNGLISHYRVIFNAREAGSGGAGTLDLMPSEVVHVTNTSPSALFDGTAPTTAGIRSMEVDRIASERQKANLLNKISPGLIVSIKGLFGISTDQRDNIEAWLQEKYQKATDDGRPLVIGEGNTVEAAPMTTQQLDYFDTRKFSRDEVLATYGTPPPIVGVYDQATLQNFGQARVIWWSTALFPRLKRVFSAFNRQLIDPRFNRSNNIADVRLWYDITGSDIGLQLLDQKLDIGLKYSKLGYPTNAINTRLELGMPAFPELNIPNVQLVEAGRGEQIPQAALDGTASLALEAEFKHLGDTPQLPKLSILG